MTVAEHRVPAARPSPPPSSRNGLEIFGGGAGDVVRDSRQSGLVAASA
jgi:hypothetical protein